MGTCRSCEKSYIGETARSLEMRISDHFNPKKNPPTAIQEHLARDKHRMDMKSFKIPTSETNRKIKEAIKIKKMGPELNQDGGYQLGSIFNDILSRDHKSPDGHGTTSQ